MDNRSKNKKNSIQTSNHRVISWMFFILNSYYAVRFLITLMNRYEVLSLQSILALLLISSVTVILVYLSFSGNLADLVSGYFKRKAVIFEIFVFYLLVGQVLVFFLGFITSAAAFEIRGWFVSNILGLILCFILGKIKLIYPQSLIINKQDNEKRDGGTKINKVFTSGILVISLVISAYWIYTQVITPLPRYFNYDPEYSYMLSSLTPFKDIGLFARMDHPGTTLQLIGAVINVIISPLTILKAGYPIYLPTSTPGAFIVAARLIVISSALFSIILLSKMGAEIRRWDSLFANLSIALFYFSAHRQALEFTTIWSPHSFYLLAGSLVLLLLMDDLSQDNQEPRKYLLISLAAGLVANIHVYLITFSIPIFTGIFFKFLLSGKGLQKTFLALGKSTLNYLVGYLMGFLVIIDQLNSFLIWLYGVVTHSGYYGHGDRGLPDQTQFFDNFRSIFHSYPELFVAAGILFGLFLYMTAFAKKDIKKYPGIWGIAFGIIIQILAISLLVGKQPRGRYLLSVASVLPILLLTIVILLKSHLTATRFIYPVIFLLSVTLFSFNLVKNITRHYEQTQYIEAYQEDVDQFLTDYSSELGIETGDIQKYWTYGTYSECYSLWFGNEYAKNLFTAEILEYCSQSQDYSISIWSGKVIPDRSQDIKDLGQNAVIIGDSTRLNNNLDLGNFQEHRSSIIPNLSYFTPLPLTTEDK